MNSKYIDSHKKYWGPEFSTMANVEYNPAHDEIAAMGAFTMLYHIADNFQDGALRDEILKFCKVKVPKK